MRIEDIQSISNEDAIYDPKHPLGKDVAYEHFVKYFKS